MEGPQQIFERLKELLDRTPNRSPESFASDLSSNPDYTQAHEYMTEISSRPVVEVSYLLEKAREVIKAGEFLGKTFRLCSVGCGGGTCDRLLLERLTAEFPSTEFHYLGVDINEVACQKARQELKSLPQKVKCSVVCYDFEKLGDDLKDEKFDFVITVQALYYTNSIALPNVLSDLLNLVARKGALVITIARESNCDGISLLYLFWIHEHKRPLMCMSDVTKALKKMNVKYTHDKLDYGFDLTGCFKDEFKSSVSKAVLDFLTHTNLSSYPPEVRDTCVEYLGAVCTEKPERFILLDIGEAVVITPDT